MATDMREFHENRDFTTCPNSFGALPVSASIFAFCSRTACMLSASIGRLLDMAKKNMSAPMVSDGSSLTTCAIARFSPLTAPS